MGSRLEEIDTAQITLLTVQPEGKIQDVGSVTETRTVSWMDEIWDYLETGRLPVERALRCLCSEEAWEVMREIHEESCGNHSGGRSLTSKIMRHGYFWPTIQRDSMQLVRKCSHYQIHGNLYYTLGARIEFTYPTWPFDHWGMDLIGPFPSAQGHKKFVLVAIDHFSKWIEAEPLANITENAVIQFIWKNLICRFGIPSKITTDMEPNFRKKKIKKWCANWKIKQIYTSVGNPKANGQTERSCPGYYELIEPLPGQVQKIPPFALAYGSEALIPAEVIEPTSRVICYEDGSNEAEQRLDLDLIEERRYVAKLRMQIYKRKSIRPYNSTVKERTIQVGDLILRGGL
ncbi:UNVERIFIED_CONTAM: hypothetical protein Slati_3522200 [Sesamum latifolium]|uniref:Integrase catalytic domain-containing protein n=1 Tax=Sesamum latifolium TaxID=2727402 RepID=A0AAW2UJE5_9LAMI